MQVPRLMHEFERGPLREYTPCRFDTLDSQAYALAVVRLQAGLPTLDFGGIRGVKKKAYIAAVHAALGGDYAPMTDVFRNVIVRTLKSVATFPSD
jgi:cell filamentation protein